MSPYRGSRPLVDDEPVPNFYRTSKPEDRREAFFGAFMIGSLVGLYAPLLLCGLFGDQLGPLSMGSPIVGLVAGTIAAVRRR